MSLFYSSLYYRRMRKHVSIFPSHHIAPYLSAFILYVVSKPYAVLSLFTCGITLVLYNSTNSMSAVLISYPHWN